MVKRKEIPVQEEKKFNTKMLPRTEAALRQLLISLLQESIVNLSTLREKEWAMAEVEHLKFGKLEGKQRNIKRTGIVRRIDDLGRIVLPKELRRTLGIETYSAMEISVDDQNGWVVVERYKEECLFCGSIQDINTYMGKRICEKCATGLFEKI